jgi:hypothetical protein
MKKQQKKEFLYENCIKISQRLIDAQKKIRILDAIKWTEDIQEDFFKHKFKKQPKVDFEYYQKNTLPYDTKAKIAEFVSIERDVHSIFGHFSPFTRLITERCSEYIRAIQMLEARGTEDFSKISIELYGSPKDSFYIAGPHIVDMSKELFKLLTVLDNQLKTDIDEKKYSAKEACKILQDKLNAYFYDLPNGVNVMVSDGIIADASAGADTIKLKEGARFSDRDLRCLEVHEGWVHIGTTLNGLSQPYCNFLSKGSPSCSVLQEGLAVLTEVITFASYPSRLRKIANRSIAMNMVLDGGTFIDIFNHFLESGSTEQESYDHSVRIFRGSLPEAGPFTKDLSYTRGFIASFNFIQYVLSQHQLDVLELLFVGKLSIQDIPLLIELRDLGLIQRPKYLPPQIRDPAGLSSWMATFLYLRHFDFKEIKNNFRFLLPAKKI